MFFGLITVHNTYVYLFSDTNNKNVNFNQMQNNSSKKTNENIVQNINKEKQQDDKDIFQVLVFHGYRT